MKNIKERRPMQLRSLKDLLIDSLYEKNLQSGDRISA